MITRGRWWACNVSASLRWTKFPSFLIRVGHKRGLARAGRERSHSEGHLGVGPCPPRSRAIVLPPPPLTFTSWSVACSASWRGFSCRALGWQGQKKWELRGLQAVLEHLSHSCSGLATCSVLPTLHAASLPCRLQAPALDVQTTHLQRLFSSSHNYLSYTCFQFLLQIHSISGPPFGIEFDWNWMLDGICSKGFLVSWEWSTHH